jgi:hypothetical protein
MTDDAPAGVPVTWPELIAEAAELYAEHLGSYDDLPAAIEKAAPPFYPGDRLGGVANTLAAVATMHAPERCLPTIDTIAPLLPRIVGDLAAGVDAPRRLTALHILSYLSVARCCGSALPDAADGAEPSWLPQLTTHARALRDRHRHTLALAACAAGLPHLVPAFTGGADLPGSLDPGATFGFDVPGFARHLAVALVRGEPYADVEPAWLDFVHRFPYKLAAETLDWSDLMWAARAVMATIGDIPEGEVAAELHALVAD